MALARCPCAFWQRRLAQSAPREFCFFLACRILPKNSGIKWLLWHVQMHFDCAGSRATVVPVSACGILPDNSPANGFRCMSMCMSTAQARTKKMSYVLVLAWSEILARSSWWDPLSQVLAWRCCNRRVLEVVVWKLLYEALRRCLHQDFLSATPAAAGFFMRISGDSLMCPQHEDIGQEPWQDLVEIRLKCCQWRLHDLLEVLLRSSCRGPREI